MSRAKKARRASSGSRSFRITLALACGHAIALSGAAEAQVRWKSGLDGVAWKMPAVEIHAEVERLAARPDKRRVVVQFAQPVGAPEREKLERSGVRLLSYLGDNAFFATIEPDAVSPLAIAAIDELAAIQPVKTAWKMDPFFMLGEVPTWAVVGEALEAPENKDGPPGDIEAMKVDPIIGAYLMLHADAALDVAAENMIARHGGVVRASLKTANSYVIELPLSQVAALAEEDRVQWIEPALPRMSEVNNSNRMITGADTVQAAPYGLTGEGVTVLVYDGGRALATHVDFGGRLTARDNSGLSDHATHVSGTVGGSGLASSGQYRGMAPGVTIESYGFQHDGSGTFLYTNPGDIEADYGEAINTYGADIANNSIGTNTASNGFPCEFEGNYGVTDVVIDSIVRGSLGSPFRIVWANGNERSSGRCGTTYRTTAPPACAKNHITVGALYSNNDVVTTFTSWGPADDGRMKPDVSAPGSQQGDDGGVTSCSSNSSNMSYSVKSGTSMASPTVCGIAALILQDYRTLYPGEPDFRNSTLKVILAHTAQDLENPGPDNKTGYGSVRAPAAIEFVRSGNFLENAVAHGETVSYLVVVGQNDTEFKATIAWDDVPGTPNVNPNLVNDLDIRVFDPNNVERFPWTLSNTDPGAPAVRTQRNSVDNIEQVFVENATPGVWRVDIVGVNVPSGGPQPFSLGASPLLINCSSEGIVRLDSQAYRCEDTLVVRVVDCDLNTDDQVAETILVTVSSDSEPAGELVLLTETGPQTAAFEGSIVIGSVDSTGVLLVADGDTVIASYVDADDGLGGTNVLVESSATVDCVAPVVSNVATVDVMPRNARVTFLTDEPARAVVRYGLSCDDLTSEAFGAGAVTMHSITLPELTDNLSYYYEIEVEDLAGNVVVADNMGACFTFATPEIPDYFTELFSNSDNDTDLRTMTFTPNGSVDFYEVCQEPISVLPVDPEGGTLFSMTSNSNRQVTLAGGAQVWLYGVPYSTFFVGSNGYVSFNTGDTSATESLSSHFNRPRISALYDNLNPAQGGTVSWRQLVDRIVVTWLGVPESSAGNSNTFQIEMHFDGRIVISWLDIAATDGLAGLSAGGGIPSEFFESDLSSYGACGPMPPGARNQSVGLPANSSLVIELEAIDDGLPDPPASLTYTVESLPANGRLLDSGLSLINAAPHTLAGGANTVTYVSNLGYTGPDSFTFSADDGGESPEGGPSNFATVSIVVGVPELIYEFNLDVNPGWTMDNGWEFGVPLGGGSHNRDPTSGFTGVNVFGYNLEGNYPNNLTPIRYVTTGAIDCTELTQTRLDFRRWLGIESSTFDKANLQASNDGVNWITIWQHTGPAISEAAWSLQSYDISAVADGHPAVQIRWGLGPTDSSVTYPGWNIDDVQIWGVQPPTVVGTGPDLNGDGQVNSEDLALMLGSWGPCPAKGACAGDFDGDGVVGSSDLAVLLGSWGPVG